MTDAEAIRQNVLQGRLSDTTAKPTLSSEVKDHVNGVKKPKKQTTSKPKHTISKRLTSNKLQDHNTWWMKNYDEIKRECKGANFRTVRSYGEIKYKQYVAGWQADQRVSSLTEDPHSDQTGHIHGDNRGDMFSEEELKSWLTKDYSLELLRHNCIHLGLAISGTKSDLALRMMGSFNAYRTETRNRFLLNKKPEQHLPSPNTPTMKSSNNLTTAAHFHDDMYSQISSLSPIQVTSGANGVAPPSSTKKKKESGNQSDDGLDVSNGSDSEADNNSSDNDSSNSSSGDSSSSDDSESTVNSEHDYEEDEDE